MRVAGTKSFTRDLPLETVARAGVELQTIGDVGGVASDRTGRARPRNQNKTIACRPSRADPPSTPLPSSSRNAHIRISLDIESHIRRTFTMAPVEGAAAARNNVFAYAPFGGHIALVVGLTAHVLLVARRAAKSLPPTTSTRSQQPLRRRHAIIFSSLAALSLASVTTFAFIWRAISYVDWAHSGASNAPNSLHSGPYGTDTDSHWYLGDWVYDIDLQKESDKIAVTTPEGFLYTSQHFVGLLAASIFFGIEGR